MRKTIIKLLLILHVFFIYSCLTTANVEKKPPGAVIGKFTIKIVNQWYSILPGSVFSSITLHVKRGPFNDTIDIQTKFRKGIFYLKNLKPGVYEIESFSFENIDSGVHSVSYYSFEKAPLNIKFLVFEKTITVMDSAQINIEVLNKRQSHYKIEWADEKEMLKTYLIEKNKKYSDYNWNEIDF